LTGHGKQLLLNPSHTSMNLKGYGCILLYLHPIISPPPPHIHGMHRLSRA
jgi:hypothetical protein